MYPADRHGPTHARRDTGAPLMPRHLAERPTAPLPRIAAADAVVYALPESVPTGLRKFDLGTVPASVTPPRSWRRAAWFAVGTSTLVISGLAAAAVGLMSAPAPSSQIDALPAYPTEQIQIDQLPAEASSSAAEAAASSAREKSEQSTTLADTAIGTSAAPEPGTSPSEPGTPSGETTSPVAPMRSTVGETPVTPTNPQAMGDRTEAFYELVTENPQAAHEMTAGGMRAEGAEGIEARYGGVERIEVQEIVIDRSQAITTSTVKIVHADGTETVETRRLTFTWGGDPKISDESAS